jgi:hypothetical protein
MTIRTNGDDNGYVSIPELSLVTPTFTSNNYTAVLADKDKFVQLSNSTTAGTFTIPENSSVPFPIGAQINMTQSGSGQITITPVNGNVTINSSSGLKLRAQWSSATIVKRATNAWLIFGDLSA